MDYAKLFVFYIASFVMLMRIHSFSTYHKFFKYALPVQIIYGFLTILVIYAIYLIQNYRSQKKSINLIALDDDRET